MAAYDDVLRILIEHTGESISGSELARNSGVTRAAIWKLVEKLRAEGYRIDAVTNRGYRFLPDNDILSRDAILRELRTKKLGRDIFVHKILESTNKTAKQMAQDGAEHGTLVLSEQQTGGRGRLGRDFYSPPKSGIYMSVILRPKISSEASLLITSGTAVAVSRAIASVLGVRAQIKWVNDVYVGAKKVCGILTEGGLNFENGMLDYVVVGIGINVNTKDFPDEIKSVAASLTDESIDRCRLVAEILNELELIFDSLPDTDFMLEYRQRSMIIGHDVWVIRADERYKARALDVNSAGNLIVMSESGEIKTISSGEVSIRRIN